MMQIIKTTDSTEGAQQLLARLTAELLANKRVLWLIPGGSNIATSVQIMQEIPDELTQRLTLALTDERYGPEGHPDSNWKQLYDLGFNAKSARRVTVLQSNLRDLTLTAEQYSKVLGDLFAEHQVVIGQFGMGPDGHIAGILPHTKAVEAAGLAVGYKTDTFERISSTFKAIKHIDAAYVFAFGDAKKAALQNLQKDLSLTDQPAQILKQLPEAYVYNDQIGGTT